VRGYSCGENVYTIVGIRKVQSNNPWNDT
jgi:hypothetical protein